MSKLTDALTAWGIIKNETRRNANTHTRIGDAGLAILEVVQEKANLVDGKVPLSELPEIGSIPETVLSYPNGYVNLGNQNDDTYIYGKSIQLNSDNNNDFNEPDPEINIYGFYWTSRLNLTKDAFSLSKIEGAVDYSDGFGLIGNDQYTQLYKSKSSDQYLSADSRELKLSDSGILLSQSGYWNEGTGAGQQNYGSSILMQGNTIDFSAQEVLINGAPMGAPHYSGSYDFYGTSIMLDYSCIDNSTVPLDDYTSETRSNKMGVQVGKSGFIGYRHEFNDTCGGRINDSSILEYTENSMYLGVYHDNAYNYFWDGCNANISMEANKNNKSANILFNAYYFGLDDECYYSTVNVNKTYINLTNGYNPQAGQGLDCLQSCTALDIKPDGIWITSKLYNDGQAFNLFSLAPPNSY